MMDFRPDEEQKMLTDTIARFARERVRKVYRDAEEEGEIPAALVQAGWEIGLLPTALPEAYGGFGDYSAVTGALALEEFAWGDLAITLNVMTPNLVAIPIMLCGTEQQKGEYLPQFCEEAPPKVSAALTEPAVQFSPYKLQTKATQDGDAYVLKGTKTFVPLADEAEVILVYAAEEGQTQAFLVPATAAGLTIGKRDKLMGVRSLPTNLVTLADVRVPLTARLGGEAGIDFGLILNHSRVALGAAAVGVARAGFEYARDYAKQRVQFGEPIAHRQSIAFMLADMATEVDEARLLVWEAAWLLDRGQNVTREATIMKQQVDRMVMQVTDRAVQILGGYGYIREYPVELWLRNARGFAAFDGLAMI
ncbi:Acyl-CoA dehydrogenase domain protein [Candidatus Promineifilum breve]|uniref:Acyl-CoA dehydrogenase domain protein n=1 Tax=Candidatus Promineifilum breve TaxID=1806508 RepID=A0A160SYC8_9CHLR|nr:acyl-CoA dehydrogenase family protein [Candidatus Promineifilum breve]CUS02276.2 Acyl-CoA dehydrogenase domain protein [Candidatus Promineifilum breve]